MNPIFVVLIVAAATVSFTCATWILVDIDSPMKEHFDQYHKWFWFLAAPMFVAGTIALSPLIAFWFFIDWLTKKGTK